MLLDTRCPTDLYYQKGFMWAKITGNIARVGLIDYAQKLAGDISYVELPFEGDEVSQGSEVGSVETGKWVGKLFAPLSGKITKVNEKLNDDPTLINRDPYGEGWAFEIEITDASEIANLMDVSAAAEWLKEEVLAKFRQKKYGFTAYGLTTPFLATPVYGIGKNKIIIPFRYADPELDRTVNPFNEGAIYWIGHYPWIHRLQLFGFSCHKRQKALRFTLYLASSSTCVSLIIPNANCYPKLCARNSNSTIRYC